MSDSGQPTRLMVKFPDGTEMSLNDFLQKANDAVREAGGIPGSATVVLTDGRRMSASEYLAQVEQRQREAQDYVDKRLDDFTQRMTVIVKDLSDSGAHLSQASQDVTSIRASLEAGMRGFDRLHRSGSGQWGDKWDDPIGNDEAGLQFRRVAVPAVHNVVTNHGLLSQSLGEFGRVLNEGGQWAFDTEREVRSGFGRQTVDPRRAGRG